MGSPWVVDFLSLIAWFQFIGTSFSDGPQRYQLQPHNLFIAGEVVNQVDESYRGTVNPPAVADAKPLSKAISYQPGVYKVNLIVNVRLS